MFNCGSHGDRICVGNNFNTDAYIKIDWTVTSDERDKTDIQDVTRGLSFINQLKPKSFYFRRDRTTTEKSGKKRYGFLAQDILPLEGSDPIIIDNEDTNHLKYKGESLVPILVKAVQELSAEIEVLKAA